MKSIKKLSATLCIVGAVLWAQCALAGVVIGGTRVIYDGNKAEAALTVSNPTEDTPYLIQTWVDNADASDTTKVPFLITPPLFRLDAGQENALRIVRTGGNLPEDRESVYWLNVKSIPASKKSTQNQLEITVKARMKLFYRPAALVGLKADDAYKSLVFSQQGNLLRVNNPTPFFISFYSLKVNNTEIKDAGMVAPKSNMSWPLPGSSAPHIPSLAHVSWQAITDFGGITPIASAAL